jgi:PIN domain nuclease of toxin-antitoxin system
MNYLLDTNVILFYLIDNDTKNFIEEKFGPFKEGNTAIISIVSIGEIGVLARRNGWGRTLH